MKRLMLLRHAKSSWEDNSLSDFDRPLNKRGFDTAPFMGSLMKERNYIPDLVVSSPALRARQTAEIIRELAGIEPDIAFDDRIYEASPQSLRQVVADQSADLGSIMLVGHNPGFEGFIRSLTGEIEPMPTAALAVIDLDISKWDDISADSGRLVSLIRPKEEVLRSGRVSDI